MFLAKSKHYLICSDECRKEQAILSKREFNERGKGDKLEAADKADYHYWYNRLRKLKKEKDAEAVAKFKAAFDAHRKEAVKRKAAVKQCEITPSDYTNWLLKEQVEVDIMIIESNQ